MTSGYQYHWTGMGWENAARGLHNITRCSVRYRYPVSATESSARPDSIFRTQGNAITSPHFRTYMNHLPLVSQITSINPNVRELSFAVVFHSAYLRLHYLATFMQPNVSSAANPTYPMHYVQTRCSILLSSQMPIGTRGAISQR